MDKKKILYFITKGNFGGAQRYVFDLATNLPRDQFEVLVVLGEGDFLEKKLIEKGIRVLRIPSLKRNFSIISDIKSLFAFVKIVREENPDVVHLNSSKAGGLGALAVRFVNIRSILNYSTTYTRAIFTGHGWAFNEKRNVVSKIIIAVLHYLTILLSHETIAVSRKVANQISVFPLVSKRIHLIYNGIHEIQFLEKAEARNSLGNFKEEFWIGTISELHKNKGLDFLIKAFASVSKAVPQASLIVIGSGEEQNNLSKLIQKLHMSEKVHLVGFKEHASKYLKAFDIFTLTSRTEAFPYAPLEAGLASLPVIASRVGGIPEAIEHKRNGMLVEAGNVFQIEYALRELLDNEEKRKRFGSALKADVEQKFSLSKMIENTIALY